MSDYEQIANEYRHSAEVTMSKIRELESKKEIWSRYTRRGKKAADTL